MASSERQEKRRSPVPESRFFWVGVAGLILALLLLCTGLVVVAARW